MEQIKGKYRLEHLLGRSGMAEVFYARTIGAASSSRPVAVKRILAGGSADEQFQSMFESEAKLITQPAADGSAFVDEAVTGASEPS